MTPAEREAHVRQLCAEAGVELRHGTRPTMYSLKLTASTYPPFFHTYGIAFNTEIEVVSPDGWTELAYLAALHELGHAVHQHASKPRYTEADVQRHEAEAWAWALDHTQEPVSVASQVYLRACLDGYRMLPHHPLPEECRRVVAHLLKDVA